MVGPPAEERPHPAWRHSDMIGFKIPVPLSPATIGIGFQEELGSPPA